MTGRYVAWRLLQVPVAVLGILLVSFVLIHLAPGDPVLALAGDHGDPAYYAEMRAKFGLDRTLPEQLVVFVVNAAHLDLGVSYVQGRPALAVVVERLPATLLLTGSALVVSTLIGIALGVFAASHPDGWPSAAINLTLLGLLATPGFWLAQLALVALALHAGWLPVAGMTDPRSSSTGLGAVVDVARHLVLPMSVLAAGEVAVISRLTRVGLLHELRQDYIRTARAKGLTESRILSRHALRLTMLPVLTVIGSRVGHLLSGAVLVEMVFGWPGIGRLLLSSVQARDIPIVLVTFMVVGLSVVLANVLTDLTYVRLDPRIRYR